MMARLKNPTSRQSLHGERHSDDSCFVECRDGAGRSTRWTVTMHQPEAELLPEPYLSGRRVELEVSEVLPA